MVTLLTIGLAVLAGGVLALVYGIPIKEFGFGNTLIIAGTVAACTGLVLIGLAVVVRQLRRLADEIEALQVPQADVPDRAAGRGAADGREPVIAPPPRPAPPVFEQDAPPPRPEAPEPALRAEPPGLVPEPVAPPAAPASPARRNLLFVSSRRERERERARDRGADPAAPPAAYSELAAPAAAEPGAAPAAAQEPPPVTVVKSGAVDGMAYSLYSDGSIEAQLPEGLMRFASIGELRAHLDRQP